MSVNVNPYLYFEGEAAEAIAFYAEVFGGTTSSMTFGDMGVEAADANWIMHGEVSTDHGFTLLISDMPPENGIGRREGMKLALSGDDASTLRRQWEALTTDGAIDTPLEKQVWGDEFGTCTDRFGVPWLVNIAGSAA